MLRFLLASFIVSIFNSNSFITSYSYAFFKWSLSDISFPSFSSSKGLIYYCMTLDGVFLLLFIFEYPLFPLVVYSLFLNDFVMY